MVHLTTFTTMRRLLPALLGASLLLGACGDDDNDDQSAVTSIPDDTTTSTSSTTTEPRTVAPDVIPQDVELITEEYVEQVLDELYIVSLRAIQEARKVGLVDEAAIQLLESVSTPDRGRQEINDLVDLSLGGFAGFREELRPVIAEVTSVIQGTPACIFAEIRIDNSGYFEQSVPFPPNVRGFAKLVPASEEQRASGHNPTAWVIEATPATEDGTVPSEGCSSP